tara:strand:+ start:147 stop:1082 length:936 start_codon:yes stop_codon:yes gene_type:complete
MKKIKIIFATSSLRGVSCIKYLKDTYEIMAIITNKTFYKKNFTNLDKRLFLIGSINNKKIIEKINILKPDFLILGGYNEILKEVFFKIKNIVILNLHAGDINKYRGSSPLNWALMNNEQKIILNVLKLDKKIDNGPIIANKTIKIKNNFNIQDLHKIADKEFPLLLNKAIRNYHKLKNKKNNKSNTKFLYYPLRDSNDSYIFLDRLNALEVHNKIRALAIMYGGGIMFYENYKISINKSRMTTYNYYGTPGKIYQIKNNELLVCAKDKCLWISDFVIINKRNKKKIHFKRYTSFHTIENIIIAGLLKNKNQ